MENKKKRQKNVKSGFRGVRGASKANTVRGRAAVQGKRKVQQRSTQNWKRQGRVQTGFIKKKNAANTMFRAKSNNNLNKIKPKNNNNNVRGNFVGRRLNTSRVGLARSKSRNNLAFVQNRNFTNEINKINGKRTNSMPNLRDPNSVHSRLGYQSPAQIAYRNRIKRAKQLLIRAS